MAAREERFALMTDALRARCGSALRVLDQRPGPGSLAMRVVRTMPGAPWWRSIATQVLLELGRRALAEETRIRFVDHDLSDPGLA